MSLHLYIESWNQCVSVLNNISYHRPTIHCICVIWGKLYSSLSADAVHSPTRSPRYLAHLTALPLDDRCPSDTRSCKHGGSPLRYGRCWTRATGTQRPSGRIAQKNAVRKILTLRTAHPYKIYYFFMSFWQGTLHPSERPCPQPAFNSPVLPLRNRKTR